MSMVIFVERGDVAHWVEAGAHVAQLAERVLGKDEVAGSIPAVGFSRIGGSSWLGECQRSRLGGGG